MFKFSLIWIIPTYPMQCSGRIVAPQSTIVQNERKPTACLQSIIYVWMILSKSQGDSPLTPAEDLATVVYPKAFFPH